MEKEGSIINTPYSLIALHGFLGLPSDWELLKLNHLSAIDFFSLVGWANLDEWAKQIEPCIPTMSSRSILMGYSLGGRLALHLLLNNPQRWHAAIIISAHPGLSDPLHKQMRLKDDEEWAGRFLNEEWNDLMAAWNKRDAFAQSHFTFDRIESNYERWQLAHILQAGSLGRQQDLRPIIGQLNLPILWIVGERDKNYCALAHSLTFKHPLSKLALIADAGHRAPWEQSTLFKNELHYFVKSIFTK